MIIIVKGFSNPCTSIVFVIFQNNTFAEIWSQADRNWKYSKTYYQVISTIYTIYRLYAIYWSVETDAIIFCCRHNF